jgi:hypothetical protein
MKGRFPIIGNRLLVLNPAGGYAWCMLKLLKVSSLLVLFLTGCVAYEPATAVDGVISNSKVGWNGYSVRIPEGLVPLKSSPDERVPDRASEIKDWYADAASRYTADYYTTFSEQFLMENPERTLFVSFITETYELPSGWGTLSSVELQYIIQKLINRKMVVINDTKARSEQIEMKGQRGWYVSGTSTPYFRKKEQSLAYEGIFLIGDLKEVFWFEAFGDELARGEMKKGVHEMANSLEVK